MIETEIKSIIHTYLEKYHALQAKGGATRDGDLYHEVSLLEKQMLRRFGLPRSNKFTNIIWRVADSEEDNDAAIILFNSLTTEAECYLTTHPKTFSQLLSQARLSKADPFDILPEILVGPNSYTLFIYNEILIKNIDSEENVMNEFSIIRKKECLTEIYQLTQLENWEESDLFRQLQSIGLKYLPRYMSWFANHHPQIDIPADQKINEKSGFLKTKVDDVCFLLNLAYKQYLKLLNQGFDDERAKRMTGLSDARTFFIAYTLYHNPLAS
ncbi:MAG: hypothetical protein WCP69_13625 [Bacteroidota bacterium]